MKEKFEGNRYEQPRDWQDVLGIDREIQRSKNIDKQIEEIDRKKPKTYDEIERLVQEWKEQKKICGVRDSDVENRVQVDSDLIQRHFLQCLTMRQ